MVGVFVETRGVAGLETPLSAMANRLSVGQKGLSRLFGLNRPPAARESLVSSRCDDPGAEEGAGSQATTASHANFAAHRDSSDA